MDGLSGKGRSGGVIPRTFSTDFYGQRTLPSTHPAAFLLVDNIPERGVPSPTIVMYTLLERLPQVMPTSLRPCNLALEA